MAPIPVYPKLPPMNPLDHFPKCECDLSVWRSRIDGWVHVKDHQRCQPLRRRHYRRGARP